MESENGAKGGSRQDSVDERDDLKQQVKDDSKFIKQTEKVLTQHGTAQHSERTAN